VGSFGKGIGKKALIVTDTVLEQKGVLNEIKNSLELSGVAHSVYNKVVNEPTMGYTEEGLKAYKESGADFLIAVGGGSPIDTAKAIAVGNQSRRKVTEFLGANKIPNPGSPLIAIPTTAGTGSEVTQFTIITDTDRDVKMLIASPMIMPKVALVDPLRIFDAPEYKWPRKDASPTPSGPRFVKPTLTDKLALRAIPSSAPTSDRPGPTGTIWRPAQI
jgi:alcohol dehydrogenase class IV